MSYDPEVHRRRSIRLRNFDYAASGGYFLTLCTFQRTCLFGDVVEGAVKLNEAGELVREEWVKSGDIRDEIHLGEFVVMPNHFHAIVLFDLVGAHGMRPSTGPFISDPSQGASRAPLRKPKSLGALVAGFKSAVTRRINGLTGNQGGAVWQRNYHEHVIRSEKDLNAIRRYIADNPIKWELDENHPCNIPPS
jgi:putative transposase